MRKLRPSMNSSAQFRINQQINPPALLNCLKTLKVSVSILIKICYFKLQLSRVLFGVNV